MTPLANRNLLYGITQSMKIDLRFREVYEPGQKSKAP